MKLYCASASPYVRKVMVMAKETGLYDQLQQVTTALTPVAPDEALVGDNPLGKIPTLVLDDGTALYDSRVICEYLDSLHKRKKKFPSRGEARFKALALQALGDGMLDAAVNTRYETFLRPEQYRWPDWISGQRKKFRRPLGVLEARAEDLEGPLSIGTITIGCALGYRDFCYGDDPWGNTHPRLAAWFKKFERRR
ncbi:MAG: glutathione S-transferase, partial [Gammaproteobacteria bacterium]